MHAYVATERKLKIDSCGLQNKHLYHGSQWVITEHSYARYNKSFHDNCHLWSSLTNGLTNECPLPPSSKWITFLKQSAFIKIMKDSTSSGYLRRWPHHVHVGVQVSTRTARLYAKSGLLAQFRALFTGSHYNTFQCKVYVSSVKFHSKFNNFDFIY